MRTATLHRLTRREAGQATVEFALVLPLLVLVILLTVDFGKAFNYWIDETHLANTAARWAAVNQLPGVSGCSGSQQLACQMAQQANAELKSGSGSTPGGVTVSFCSPGPSAQAGQVGQPVRARVTMTYHWLSFLTGPLGIPGLTDKTITSTATMRLERKNDLTNYDGSAPC